jgi:hypothetical protein
MAKYKPAKAKGKGKASGMRGAVPCVVFLVCGMALLILLFAAILKQ